MLNIKKFVCNMFQENCYIVNDETNECIIIDCGANNNIEEENIKKYISNNKLKPCHLLCTHAHIDHNFGNEFIFNLYGLKPTVCKEDKFLFAKLSEQAKSFTGKEYDGKIKEPGTLIDNGDSIVFGNHTFIVISTPGHSPGSVFFYCKDENTAFSGDTLFRMSMGRTDLEGGSYEEIIKSLKNITTILPDETIVYPGHGPKTSIREERLMNPFF